MSKVVVVTDSTSGLPAELARQNNVVVAAQTLIWGEETFLDSVTIQPDEFYARLAKATVMPSSSQISPAGFEKIFREWLDKGYDVLAVLVSSKLSGTINSAVQAQAAIQSDRIAVVDFIPSPWHWALRSCKLHARQHWAPAWLNVKSSPKQPANVLA